MDKSITHGVLNQPPTKTPKSIYRSLPYMLFIWLLTSATALMAQTDITIKLLKSDNVSAVPNAGSAILKVYDSGWSTLTNNGSGEFSYTTSSTNVTFKMYYNKGVQSINTAVTGASQEVIFSTVTVTPALKNSSNVELEEGQVKHYQNGWSGLYDSNTSQELLPGNYTFRTYYNKGVQSMSGVAIAGNAQEVPFVTVSVTPTLKNSDGGALTGGEVKHYQNGWSSLYDSNDPEAPQELLPGNYTFTTYYNKGVQSLSGVTIAGTAQEVPFVTVSVAPTLKNSNGEELTGGQAKHYQNGWSGLYDSNDTETPQELLPGNYTFRTYYNKGVQSVSGVIIDEGNVSDGYQEILFETITVTPKLLACDGTTAVEGGQVKHYQNGWSGLYPNNSSTELLPGTYTFRTYFNHGIESQSGVDITSNNSPTFTAVELNINFDGLVKFYQNGWGTYTNPSYLLTGDYNFKFGILSMPLTVSCDMAEDFGNVYLFKTVKADGSPLPNIPIKRNNYGNNYVTVGNTDANGELYLWNADFEGSWKFRASKNYSNQYITTGPDYITFQTSKYVAHVEHTDGSDFEGIATKYNDYGNHWIDLDPQYTDAFGNASIELFPGNYNFRAIKNYSVLEKSLEIASSGNTGTVDFQTTTFTALVKHTNGDPFEGIATEYNDYGNHWIDLHPQSDDANGNLTDANGEASIELFPGTYSFRATKNYSSQTKDLEVTTSGDDGTVEFQTATFTAHVTDSNGDDFEGIATEYNDYGNHWIDLDPQYTGTDGKATIELFPGEYTFRSIKNYSVQEGTLELTESGDDATDGMVEFQTALAVAHLEDCDTNMPIEGIQVEYNDYGTHWIDLDPQSTGVDGNASIELFPGTYDLRAKNIYTYQTKSIVLADPSVDPSTTVVFNPTRVCFNYDLVKYNDYGTHWMTLPCNTYMFPGTYDFRFYNDGNLDLETSVAIDGCAQEQAPIFVQLQDSDDIGLTNGTFHYRFGYGNYTEIGTDNTGNGIWFFIDGNPSNTKVKVSYKGSSKEIQQNIQSNPMFIFNTVNVTADLETSLSSDITNTADNWEYRFGYGPYTSFDPVAGEELLPGNTKVKVSHKGTSKEMQQNTGATSHFDFSTVYVNASLFESNLTTNITEDAIFEYRFGYGPYTTLETDYGVELLPGNTKVKVSHKGTSKEIQQNTGVDAIFDFNTVNVTANLATSLSADITGEATFHYRFGYGPFTSFNPIEGEELLAGNTKVQVSYKGTSKEMQQNTGADSSFDFQTVLATANLCGGTSGTYVYRYGYGPYMEFNPNGEELLPVNTKVKATNDGGTSQEKQQNIGSDSIFEFSFDCVAPSTVAPQVSAFGTQNTVKCYPNPTSEYVTLETDHPGNIFIFNEFGNQVHKGKGKTIDVTNYPEGLYFVKAGNYTGKFYVQH
ncbi:T9SS type A sorting domain-containing protein [Mangrovimonas sp. TPBH4]|uniref:T9SS type A sorting domain-containing protein n=1 Tax=Mangrovimonas sp. TPBH4 TaxID=1645914 RepID=UPI0006B4C684|nr:T9SS type A sorting domain-containing protein [Mangrovimonas sp. TPBH4]